MKLIIVLTVLLMSSLTLAEEVDFDTQGADMALACYNLDFSDLTWHSFARTKNPHLLLIFQKGSWVDLGTIRKRKPVAIIEVSDKGCSQIKVGLFPPKAGEALSSSNQDIFMCSESIRKKIFEEDLIIDRPKLSEKEGSHIDTRVYSYPIVNKSGKKIYTLTSTSTYNNLIADDNDWRHEGCSLK